MHSQHRVSLSPSHASTRAPLVRVFTIDGDPRGGNPAPVWLDAEAMTGAEMQSRARASGHESVFVTACSDGVHRWEMRYFVPMHEMEMCGHATIAALWLLHAQDRWDGEPVAIRTASGTVHGRRVDGRIEISQPPACMRLLGEGHIRSIVQCLGLRTSQVVDGVLNASTSRAKTLIRLDSMQTLHALRVNAEQVPIVCERIGSTGLYPYAVSRVEPREVHCSARQFPRASGYLEDPATGIAAAALAWGLRRMALVGPRSAVVTVRQGEAMGSPSQITVRMPAVTQEAEGCWVGGQALLETDWGGQWI